MDPPDDDPSGGYTVTFSTHHTPRAGIPVPITFQLWEPNGVPVPWSNLAVSHGRKLHIIFVSADLDVFGHVHPEEFTSDPLILDFPVEFTFPKSGKLLTLQYVTALGKYLAILDFTPLQGVSKRDSMDEEVLGKRDSILLPSYSAKTIINVLEPLIGTAPAISEIVWDFSTTKTAAGYKWDAEDTFLSAALVSEASSQNITMDVSLTVNNGATKLEEGCIKLLFEFFMDNSPVTTFLPYMEANAHLVLVHESLSHSLHVHGSSTNSKFDPIDCQGHYHGIPPETYFGPLVQAYTAIVNIGKYRVNIGYFIVTTTGFCASKL